MTSLYVDPILWQEIQARMKNEPHLVTAWRAFEDRGVFMDNGREFHAPKKLRKKPRLDATAHPASNYGRRATVHA